MDFRQLLNTLSDAGCEFVIVGGVAAMLHGGNRVTFDLDVVPKLDGEGWRRVLETLWKMGARPRIPESLDAICEPQNIARWVAEKGMLALNMRSADGNVEVDFLVGASGDYERLRKNAIGVKINRRTFYVASIDDLIAMKRKANRPQDLLDIEQLEAIKRNTAL